MKSVKRMVAFCLLGGLTACQSMAEVKTLSAGSSVVNTVLGTNIVSSSYNGYEVGGSSGGGESCCISLPEKWQPGMTAVIDWVKDPSPGVNPGGVRPPPRGEYGSITKEGYKWYEIHEENYVHHQIRIPVPKYDRVSSLTLVFLPCDQVYPLIDSAQSSYVMGKLPYDTWEEEIIKRLGGKLTCQRK